MSLPATSAGALAAGAAGADSATLAIRAAHPLMPARNSAPIARKSARRRNGDSDRMRASSALLLPEPVRKKDGSAGEGAPGTRYYVGEVGVVTHAGTRGRPGAS